MSHQAIKIALVGNPNSGKTSLFNALTGLNQKVGNFPGVTVDKKTGTSKIPEIPETVIIDLPGTYSLYPKSADEQVSFEVLMNPHNPDKPDIVVVIADASNLKRNLLFCSQITDLKMPVVLCLSMLDIAKSKGVSIDINELERQMGVPIVAINPRKNKGIPRLKKVIGDIYKQGLAVVRPDFIPLNTLVEKWAPEAMEVLGTNNKYAALQIACNLNEVQFLNAAQRMRLTALLDTTGFQKSKVQAEEIMLRYQKIGSILQQCLVEESPVKKALASERIDKVLLHPVWGNLILLTVLFFLFQSIFWLATFPMDWIELGFGAFSNWLGSLLPDNIVKDILINGLLAGISGIVVFIPQIMILFGFITILEDTGYMARISFLTDRLMRSMGLNGRAVMPIISGIACAVPAIMATRTIQNRKERLITILVTPLMSCSARLPVYTILIGLVIPNKYYLGFINLQGMVLMGLYLLGFVMALIVSKILNFIIVLKDKTYFLMELPVYRAPRWKNVLLTMIEKAKIFVLDAGKVIMIISLLLWAMSSYGPPSKMKQLEESYTSKIQQATRLGDSVTIATLKAQHQTDKLEVSFAGIMGHAIEPAIRPLGYDWKIGIALITSFAAREVFVGTMATLYSVGDTDDNESTLMEKMSQAHWPSGAPIYTLASGVSLLLFYLFAMQCMSTMAIVKRETRSWKWPIIQFAYMLVLAYGLAWVAFAALS